MSNLLSQDHLVVIRKALIEQRGDIFAAIGYQTTVTASDEMVVELAAIEAALAAINAPATPPPVDDALDGVLHWLDVVTTAVLDRQDEWRPEVGIAASALVDWMLEQRTPTPQPVPATVDGVPDEVIEAIHTILDSATMPHALNTFSARLTLIKWLAILAGAKHVDKQQRPPAAHVPPRRG